MQSVATKTRINQITLLVGISFLFYELTNWVEGIWVIISTVVVLGPFSTFLGFEKAKDRFLGTLVGLVVAAGVEYYLRFNPSHLPVVAVAIGFVAGFMATKPYKYYIIMVTLCTCIGYTYMNEPYTTFAPISFMFDRAMGVFVGVLIFFLMQRFVFGEGNSKLELLEESRETLQKLQKTLLQYKDTPSMVTAFTCAADIFQNTRDIKSDIGSASLVLSNPRCQEVVYAKQVLALNQRALAMLIDQPTIEMRQIDRLLRIVSLKLARQ